MYRVVRGNGVEEENMRKNTGKKHDGEENAVKYRRSSMESGNKKATVKGVIMVKVKWERERAEKGK